MGTPPPNSPSLSSCIRECAFLRGLWMGCFCRWRQQGLGLNPCSCLTLCVTKSKWLHLSGPLFPHL